MRFIGKASRIVGDSTLLKDGSVHTFGWWVETRRFLVWRNRGYFESFDEAEKYRETLIKREDY